MAARSYSRPDVTVSTLAHCTKISGTGNPPADVVGSAITSVSTGTYSGSGYSDRDPDDVRAHGGLLPMFGYLRHDYRYTRPVGTYFGTFVGPNPKYTYMYTGPQGYSLGSGSISGKGVTSARVKITEMSRDIDLGSLQQEAFASIAPSLDLLTSSAELGKTVKMILGIRRRALALIREGLQGGWSTAKAIASARLEWRYGWRILGYDIENFVGFVNNPLRDQILLGKSPAVELKESETVISGNIGGAACSYSDKCDINRNLSVRVRAGIRTNSRSVNLLVSPVTTAWELIPFSFVADWIVGVGSALSAYQVLSSSAASTSAVGYLFEEESTSVPTNIAVGTGSGAMSPFGVSYKNTSFCTLRMRVQLGSPPLLPRLNVKLDPGRLLDAAALLLNFKKDLRK